MLYFFTSSLNEDSMLATNFLLNIANCDYHGMTSLLEIPLLSPVQAMMSTVNAKYITINKLIL